MKKRNDILLLCTLATIAVVAIFGSRIYKSQKNSADKDLKEKVIVSINGKEVAEYDLSYNNEYKIELDNDEYNTLKIEDKKAVMIDSTCPDKLCIHQGSISHAGDIIVCLPHGLIAEIKSDKSGEVDIIR